MAAIKGVVERLGESGVANLRKSERATQRERMTLLLYGNPAASSLYRANLIARG